LAYDELVIAVRVPAKQIMVGQVQDLKGVQDCIQARLRITWNQALDRCQFEPVIVGGGLIGIEMAEKCYAYKKIPVTFWFGSPWFFGIIPTER